MQTSIEATSVSASAALAEAIRAADCSRASVTVVGYGAMGRQYVRALQALGVSRLRVCSRSAGRLAPLGAIAGIETVAGGVERLACRPQAGELAVVATPIQLTVAAADRLAALGFRRLLLEKPVALSAADIEQLAERLEGHDAEAYCAYNRVAYPSAHEVRARAEGEGGVTSCRYAFTEMIKPDWPQRFSHEELARWGISNSIHVISMAHGLIGWPASWSGHRAGSLAWHPTGSVFVGSGVSGKGLPFAYHADWGSPGRWSVEVATAHSVYRLCPLERLFRKGPATGEWEELPVDAAVPEAKAGLVEQVAAMLSPAVQRLVPRVTLREAAALTRYAEGVFGYGAL